VRDGIMFESHPRSRIGLAFRRISRREAFRCFNSRRALLALSQRTMTSRVPREVVASILSSAPFYSYI
jgi:hypothetical protein